MEQTDRQSGREGRFAEITVGPFASVQARSVESILGAASLTGRLPRHIEGQSATDSLPARWAHKKLMSKPKQSRGHLFNQHLVDPDEGSAII